MKAKKEKKYVKFARDFGIQYIRYTSITLLYYLHLVTPNCAVTIKWTPNPYTHKKLNRQQIGAQFRWACNVSISLSFNLDSVSLSKFRNTKMDKNVASYTHTHQPNRQIRQHRKKDVDIHIKDCRRNANRHQKFITVILLITHWFVFPAYFSITSSFVIVRVCSFWISDWFWPKPEGMEREREKVEKKKLSFGFGAGLVLRFY